MVGVSMCVHMIALWGGVGLTALTPRSPSSTDGDLSSARTRVCIVSCLVSLFDSPCHCLSRSQLLRGIYFPAHLGLGRAPGFKNTW